ncbi:hypothetical protein IL306_006042 [Fusarium sp. DS 682]|nr:hypothetical protein IL306_006042 [Fusarium sp. DS 682]
MNHKLLDPLLQKVIDKDPEIGSKGLRVQFDRLILQPLSNMSKNQTVGETTVAIVIDAIDECNSEQDIKTLTSPSPQTGKLRNIKLRVFLTSRPELPIRLAFGNMTGTFQDLILHEIPATVIEHDISAFFKHELEKVLLEWNSSVAESRRLPLTWPGESVLRSLVERAVPLFIFAAMVCRFIADRNGGPRTRLNKVIEYSTWKAADKMQATYAPVLDQLLIGLSPAEKKEALCEFKLIVGAIVTLENPLSATELSELLGISQDRVDDRLDKLHSVLDVPDSPEAPIRLFHISFRDYLTDKENYPDNEFSIDHKEASEKLSAGCLRVMRRHLKTDMCNLCYPGAKRVDVGSQVIDSFLPPELQYACLYWVKHQQAVDLKSEDIRAIMEFMKIHLLHWIEALVLINRTWEISEFLKMSRAIPENSLVRLNFEA